MLDEGLSALCWVRANETCLIVSSRRLENSLDPAEPFGDRMKFFDELLRFLRDHRSSAGSEPPGHQTGIAEPAEIHVHSGRLQVFQEVVRDAVRPPGAGVFSLTLSDVRSRPRMSLRREIDFSRRDRGRLPVRRPARSVLVDDIQPKVL